VLNFSPHWGESHFSHIPGGLHNLQVFFSQVLRCEDLVGGVLFDEKASATSLVLFGTANVAIDSPLFLTTKDTKEHKGYFQPVPSTKPLDPVLEV